MFIQFPQRVSWPNDAAIVIGNILRTQAACASICKRGTATSSTKPKILAQGCAVEVIHINFSLESMLILRKKRNCLGAFLPKSSRSIKRTTPTAQNPIYFHLRGFIWNGLRGRVNGRWDEGHREVWPQMLSKRCGLQRGQWQHFGDFSSEIEATDIFALEAKTKRPAPFKMRPFCCGFEISKGFWNFMKFHEISILKFQKV